MKKNLKYYLNLDYTIRLKQNEDGSYFVEIEELPGCMSEGDTKVEALKMVDDAKKAWIEIALKRKIRIPEPEKDEFSGKLNVRMPKFLHRKLSYKAKEEGVSLNTLISTTLASAV
ncbi:type II toxin-antitoxin system HicB family antitoxin [Candidatus Daviesbacteria bacterium]|nr:type II toxin-antitoxin system HicB family antitoxin [Candidatus Daviesbacteria bacterium]